MTERRLQVLINDRLVGTLYEENDLWRLEYDADWRRSANGFDLSPALPISRNSHRDGASLRPVQWYFDNLLPEENQRRLMARDAGLVEEDAWGLLAHFGAESAGSLILQPEEHPVSAATGWRELTDDELERRIRLLPQVSLQHDAPKRMSLAGAQHKLLVRYEDGLLYEPLPGSVSTHILKPDHQDKQAYPASVINEFFCMTLARRLGLHVPPVYRRYTPLPVYLVERFDRESVDGELRRKHVIDACQLLNKSRLFKYTGAQLGNLADAIRYCRTRPAARLQLFRWLVFNVLIGNGDNHLKNISFTVSAEGIDLAPAYDLLSTAVYQTRAFADDRAVWPRVDLAMALPDAARFDQVNRSTLIKAGTQLGLATGTIEREINQLTLAIAPKALELYAELEQENDALPAAASLPGEMRLLRGIMHIVIADMIQQLRAITHPDV